MCRAHELSFRDLDPAAIDLVIISPNDPAAMLNYADECRDLGIRFIFDPSQQLPWLDGAQLRGAMAGAYALTVNDYELEMVKQKTGLNEQELLERVGMLVVTRGADGATLMSARPPGGRRPSRRPRRSSSRPASATRSAPG